PKHAQRPPPRFRELRDASGNGVVASAGGPPRGPAEEKRDVSGTGGEPVGGGVNTGQNRRTFRLSQSLSPRVCPRVCIPGLYPPEKTGKRSVCPRVLVVPGFWVRLSLRGIIHL